MYCTFGGGYRHLSFRLYQNTRVPPETVPVLLRMFSSNILNWWGLVEMNVEACCRLTMPWPVAWEGVQHWLGQGTCNRMPERSCWPEIFRRLKRLREGERAREKAREGERRREKAREGERRCGSKLELELSVCNCRRAM
jgi:hypothetical protein